MPVFLLLTLILMKDSVQETSLMLWLERGRGMWLHRASQDVIWPEALCIDQVKEGLHLKEGSLASCHIPGIEFQSAMKERTKFSYFHSLKDFCDPCKGNPVLWKYSETLLRKGAGRGGGGAHCASEKSQPSTMYLAECVPGFQFQSMKHCTYFLICPSTLASSNTSPQCRVPLKYSASCGCPQLAECSQIFESRYSEIHQMVMFPNKVMGSMIWSCLGGLKCLVMPN